MAEFFNQFTLQVEAYDPDQWPDDVAPPPPPPPAPVVAALREERKAAWDALVGLSQAAAVSRTPDMDRAVDALKDAVGKSDPSPAGRVEVRRALDAAAALPEIPSRVREKIKDAVDASARAASASGLSTGEIALLGLGAYLLLRRLPRR